MLSWRRHRAALVIAGATLGVCGLIVTVLYTRSSSFEYEHTRNLMRPILDAAQEAFDKEDDRSWNRFEDLLDQLSRDQTPAADEASAGLLCYYIGSHPAEMLVENLTRRGPRALPYLEKFRNAPPIAAWRYSMVLASSEERHAIFDEEAISLIRRGEVLNDF